MNPTEAFIGMDPQVQMGILIASFIGVGFTLQATFDLLKLWITKRYERRRPA